ncbi:PilZ domain-containing protein [Thalassotalea ponticola]|uniref:PilZ domain-containing protein n=1 Tax=Thalassotalea ponticola TaxID=1523392 RepID=UPI0025B3CD3D|nr:PilZ domain-containing protein [Thalassotalea ponticola]MDN3653691.1 PilZ domain-containing protein [Thalassotalea ponticola]
MEARLHPRKNIHASIRLLADPEQQRFDTTSTNLSMSGIQIAANKELVDHLLKQQTRPIHFDILFDTYDSLPFRCRLIVNRRQSHDEFLLGCKFIQLSDEHLELLTRILDQQA